MTTSAGPSPELFFDTVFAFQRTAALKAAIDLELFTAIDEGAQTVPAIAKRCKASERGTRMLCDYVTVYGFLTKAGDRYQLTPDTAFFLSKKSQAYLGGTTEFLASPELKRRADDVAATVRRGTVAEESNTVSADNPIWQTFARAMTPMMFPAAQAIADILGVASAGPIRVLDIAAGHGIFGIAIAQRNPKAEIVAVDWKGVLAVAKENAERMGVAARHRGVPGDAFTTDFGTGYDIALVTNFLHHFDTKACEGLLRTIAKSLKPGGRVAILEFVPNDDRVSPRMPAAFVFNMLVGTPAGDAYTFRELSDMLKAAGFSGTARHALPTPETLVVATK
jgi:2-polyprenyl-3-methyl-5-hydroxy-6-metoxy-1,4-benzoquinol methylase